MLQIYSSIIVTIHVHVISCKILFWDTKQRSRTSYDFPNGSVKHLFVFIPTFNSVKGKQLYLCSQVIYYSHSYVNIWYAHIFHTVAVLHIIFSFMTLYDIYIL